MQEEIARKDNAPVLNRINRFEKLKDDWVKDIQTGLEWGPAPSNKMTFADSLKWCESVGGRLPHIKELISLVDYDRREPAIHPDYFKDTRIDDYYWSKTKVVGYSDYVWCVTFRYGFVSSSYVDYTAYVRPVRASQ